jgi:hypothetical protein
MKHRTDFTIELDQSDEDIYEVSDEALEAAAGTYIGDAADSENLPVKIRSCACPSE